MKLFSQFAEVQTHILSLMFPLQLTDTHKTPMCLQLGDLLDLRHSPVITKLSNKTKPCFILILN